MHKGGKVGVNALFSKSRGPLFLCLAPITWVWLHANYSVALDVHNAHFTHALPGTQTSYRRCIQILLLSCIIYNACMCSLLSSTILWAYSLHLMSVWKRWPAYNTLNFLRFLTSDHDRSISSLPCVSFQGVWLLPMVSPLSPNILCENNNLWSDNHNLWFA